MQDFYKIIPLKRQSYDIGIFGKKGSGKTIILALLGYIFSQHNITVFSNIPLNYKHIFVESIEDLKKIYDMDPLQRKILIGDDFERWFHSYSGRTKINKQLDQIILDFGKISCSTFYSGKRSMAIDINLRENTSEFWFPKLCLNYKSEDKNINNKIKNYLNFLKIEITRYDEDLEELPKITIQQLNRICQLYETTHLVQPIKTITTNP